MNHTGESAIRVGVNALFLPPGRRSGTATYTWSLLRALSRHDGFEFVVFSQTGFLPPGVQSANVSVVACPAFSSTVARVWWEQCRLPALAARHSIDVLLTPSYVSPLFGRFAKVVTIHDMYHRQIPEALRPAQRLYWRLFIPLSAHRADVIIAVSNNTRDDIVADMPFAGSKTYVVHEAGSDALFGLEPSRAASPIDRCFLVVASVTPNKNIQCVVRATKLLWSSGYRIPLVVAGEDPFGLLAGAIQEHDAAECVKFLGGVDDQGLVNLYRNAIALIHPSRYEGFGLPILEAQALGTPVVTSRAGSLPEVAGEGALYFDSNSPADLAERLVRLAQDDSLRNDLIERGRRNAARFSWDRAASETSRLLKSAVALRSAKKTGQR